MYVITDRDEFYFVGFGFRVLLCSQRTKTVTVAVENIKRPWARKETFEALQTLIDGKQEVKDPELLQHALFAATTLGMDDEAELCAVALDKACTNSVSLLCIFSTVASVYLL